MNSRLIDRILKEGKFNHAFANRKLVETHISYVILGRAYAYKFKKAVTFSFLDFSTLPKRKLFCEREVALNNRLSSGIYLGVVPVRQSKSDITVGGSTGKIIDYAVWMKRLKSSCQMHLMLEKEQVTPKHIKSLAVLIRDFHDRTEVMRVPFSPDQLASQFNDIRSICGFVKETCGPEYVEALEQAVRISDTFLHTHQDLFRKRIQEGCVRDGHGDLHSRNIFLCPEPVVFDCIEFNDDLRKMDVLDEIAFFCMDLEAEGFFHLSEAFVRYYFADKKTPMNRHEQLLFIYYKGYRANIRAKVSALRSMKPGDSGAVENKDEVRKYLALMSRYMAELS